MTQYNTLNVKLYELLHIEVWFTDQNFKLIEIEDKINITVVIN